MKRNKKLIFSGMILLALVLTGGTFAYTYANFASATLDVTAAGGEITSISQAPTADQPDWDDILPEGKPASDALSPCAAGDETNLTPSDSTKQNWELVDDMPADDGATYVANDFKHYRTDLYNLTDHIEVEGSETIQSVTVYFRFAGDWKAEAKAVIKTYGVIFYGDRESPADGAYDTRSYQWTTNPVTNQAWTCDEINELQAGVSLLGTKHGSPTACTQVYVTINYEFKITQGAVPDGDLYIITPHPDYTGDLLIKVYLTNTANLLKAYQYLNMKLKVDGSLEAKKKPDYQVLSIENGVVLFNIEGGAAKSYTVEVWGGSYRLISGDPTEWGEDWSITPEFYCEATQR